MDTGFNLIFNHEYMFRDIVEVNLLKELFDKKKSRIRGKVTTVKIQFNFIPPVRLPSETDIMMRFIADRKSVV